MHIRRRLYRCPDWIGLRKDFTTTLALADLMPSLTRRALLRLGGVTLAGGLAGCNALDQQSSKTPQLGDLTVTNHDPQPHTVHVLLLDNGEPVYWASKEATPATDGALGGARFEEFPTKPGNYVLHVRINSQRESKWERLDFSKYDVSCIGIMIAIGDINQTNPGDVSIWKTTNPHECEDEKTTHQ